MDNNISLADTKKDETLKNNYHQYGLDYTDLNNKSLDNKTRWK